MEISYFMKACFPSETVHCNWMPTVYLSITTFSPRGVAICAQFLRESRRIELKNKLIKTIRNPSQVKRDCKKPLLDGKA